MNDDHYDKVRKSSKWASSAYPKFVKLKELAKATIGVTCDDCSLFTKDFDFIC